MPQNYLAWTHAPQWNQVQNPHLPTLSPFTHSPHSAHRSLGSFGIIRALLLQDIFTNSSFYLGLFLGIFMADSLTLSRCLLGCYVIRKPFHDCSHLLLIILYLLTLNIFVCVIHTAVFYWVSYSPVSIRCKLPRSRGLICYALLYF